jgi:hypothetical protein
MPALVNIRVGSLRGTSGDDGTISWPLSAKNLRNVDLISLTPLMSVQSQYRPGFARCPGHFSTGLGRAQNRSLLALPLSKGMAAPLLDKGTRAVQKLCRPIRGLPQKRKTCDGCCACVDSIGGPVFFSYLFSTATSGETGFDAGAEGATAPETLRQKDRLALTASGKRRERVQARMCPPTG